MTTATAPRRSLAERNALAEQWHNLPRRVFWDLHCIFPSRFRGLQQADQDDLLQVGCLALLRASETWDPSRGVKFQTFAYACIRTRILDARRPRPRQFYFRELTRSHDPGRAAADPFRHADLYAALSRLNPGDRELIEQRFGLGGVSPGRTFKDLGSERGLSREAIRKRIASALGEVGGHLAARE